VVQPTNESGERMETKVERGQASEDRFTGAIERQTAMLPSSLFLGWALSSMANFTRPESTEKE
jgi:hypothetical protein